MQIMYYIDYFTNLGKGEEAIPTILNGVSWLNFMKVLLFAKVRKIFYHFKPIGQMRLYKEGILRYIWEYRI